MAGIRTAQEEMKTANTTFLTNKELVEQHTEFCILSANYQDSGKFGPYWDMEVVYLDEAGEHVEQSIFLSAGSTGKDGQFKENKYRKTLLTEKLSYPVHSAMLISGVNGSGQNFYDIDDCDTVPPCPCQSGSFEKKAKRTIAALKEAAAQEVVEEESPIAENLEGARLHLSNLATQKGWPIPIAKINKMNSDQIRETIARFSKQ